MRHSIKWYEGEVKRLNEWAEKARNDRERLKATGNSMAVRLIKHLASPSEVTFYHCHQILRDWEALAGDVELKRWG